MNCGSDSSWIKSKRWVGAKLSITPFPLTSHLDRAEWPHSTGGSLGDAGYKWPCCVPPSGSRHCSQSGWSLQAGYWSDPEGSRGVEPWEGCSRELNRKQKAQGCRQTRSLMLTPHTSLVLFAHFLISAIRITIVAYVWIVDLKSQPVLKSKKRQDSYMQHWASSGSGGSSVCIAKFRLLNSIFSQRDTENSILWGCFPRCIQSAGTYQCGCAPILGLTLWLCDLSRTAVLLNSTFLRGYWAYKAIS